MTWQWRMISGDFLGKLPCFTPSDRRAMITSILATSTNTLWFSLGGSDGMVTISDGVWSWMPELRGQRSMVWFRSRVWTCGRDFHLYALDGETGRKIKTPFYNCRYIRIDQDEYLWAVPDKGLWNSADGLNWQRVYLGRNHDIIKCLWIDDRNIFWIMFEDEPVLYQWDHHTLQPATHPLQLGDPLAIRRIVRDHSNTIWIASMESGVWKYDRSTWEQVPQAADLSQTGLSSPIIRDMICDVQGRLWVLDTASLHCFVEGSWRPIVINPKDPIHIFSTSIFDCLAIDHQERLWLGANDGAIAWVDTTSTIEEIPSNITFHPQPPPAPRPLDTIQRVALSWVER